MKPVDQTLFRGEGEHGNCMQACVASILEVPLDEVPHFARVYGPYFQKGMREWIASKGLGLVYLGGDKVGYLSAHAIATGQSPRGDFLHSIVWRGRMMAHDPHPSRAGIVGDPHEYLIISHKP